MFKEDITVAAIIDKIKLRENQEYAKDIAKNQRLFLKIKNNINI